MLHRKRITLLDDKYGVITITTCKKQYPTAKIHKKKDQSVAIFKIRLFGGGSNPAKFCTCACMSAHTHNTDKIYISVEKCLLKQVFKIILKPKKLA